MLGQCLGQRGALWAGSEYQTDHQVAQLDASSVGGRSEFGTEEAHVAVNDMTLTYGISP